MNTSPKQKKEKQDQHLGGAGCWGRHVELCVAGDTLGRAQYVSQGSRVRGRHATLSTAGHRESV